MLNDEQKANLMETFSDGFGPSDAGAVEAPTEDVKVEQSSTPQEEQSVEVDVPVGAEASEAVADMDDSPPNHKGHNVPYKRFKSVLDARNTYRGEVDDYKSKLSSLEQKLANLEQSRTQPPQAQPATEEANWLDDYLNEGNAVPEWQQQYQGLNDRLYQFEVAQEEQSLRAELADINSKFPNVPNQMLLQAVIQDPNVDISRLAEDYSAYISGIEEGAIAKFRESQGGQSNVPPAVSRPHSSPSSGARTALKPAEKPSSVKDASDALRNLLSKNNIFKT